MEYQQQQSLYAQRASRGEENLRYLKAHTNFLTHREKKTLAVCDAKNSWKWSMDLWWLDTKRRQIDITYDKERELETKAATVANQIKNIQQIQAIEQLKRVAETGVREPTQQQADNAIAYLKRKGKL